MHLKISYQTLQLPPPFAFAYTLELDIQNDVEVIFRLEYVNRDAISLREIESDGFTADDDIHWQGSLDPVWGHVLQPNLLSTPLVNESDNDNTWIYLEMDNGRKGVLKEVDEWDYRLQELIQAIYETAGLELPLKMKFIDQTGNKSVSYELTAFFAKRKVVLNEKQIEWKEFQLLMNLVFSCDYSEDPEKSPARPGLWVDPDGQSGYWSLPKQIQNQILSILRRG